MNFNTTILTEERSIPGGSVPCSAWERSGAFVEERVGSDPM
jgi:hypothetical protein